MSHSGSTLTDNAVAVMNEGVAAETQFHDLPFALKRYRDAVTMLSSAIAYDTSLPRHYKAQVAQYIEDVKAKIRHLEGLGVIASDTPTAGGGSSRGVAVPIVAPNTTTSTGQQQQQQPRLVRRPVAGAAAAVATTAPQSAVVSTQQQQQRPISPRPAVGAVPLTPAQEEVEANWRAIEGTAAGRRVQLSAEAISKIIGAPSAPPSPLSLSSSSTPSSIVPRVGMCLSGGGWRAMTSACAMWDGLAIPLKTTQSGQSVKPLDCFSHAFGLSGGSWLLFNALLGASRDVNPYHGTSSNPWVYGSDHYFDPNIHKYEGLAKMTDKDIVDEACHRTNFRRNVGFVATRVGADSTIAAVLATKQLGSSLVERWSNFISNNLLGWVDEDFTSPADVVQRLGAHFAKLKGDAMATISKQSAANNLSVFMTKKAVDKKERELELERDLAFRAAFPSRSVRLANLKKPLSSGDLPFIVCTAIADKSPEEVRQQEANANAANQQSTASSLAGGDVSQNNLSQSGGGSALSASGSTQQRRKKRKHHPRIYDWVEFSPFFVRNPMSHCLYPTPDELQGSFAETDDPKPLFMHHLMGVCGSAFACDISSAMPVGMQRTMGRSLELPTTPLLGRGTTNISSSNMSGPPLGECRDAGIDINVPLPPMLSEAGRQFDIIVVHDAGSGSTNAHELQRAVDLGYMEVMDGTGTEPETPYRRGQYVRVFRPTTKAGGLGGGTPVVIYFIGLCERGTHQIVADKHQILKDVERIRDRVVKQLVPVLLAEMKTAQRRKERQAAALRTSTGAAISGSAELNYSAGVDGPINTEVELLDVLDEEEDIIDDEDAIVLQSAAIHEDVRTIMLAAAATGNVSNEYEAFRAAEEVIFFEHLRDIPEKDRTMALFVLEASCVARLFTGSTALKLEQVSRQILHELLEYDILIADKEARAFGMTGYSAIRVSEPWAAYFGAVALVSQVARTSGNINVLRALKRERSPPSCTSSLRSVPLNNSSNVWPMLALCVKSNMYSVVDGDKLLPVFSVELFANFEAFLAVRTARSDEEKEIALRNFSFAMSDCGLNDELVALLEKQKQTMTVGERRKVAEAAARSGNITVLRYLAKHFPSALDATSVLASGYASTDPEVLDFLRKERRLSLSFLDAVSNGYVEAVAEMVRLPENSNSQEAGVLAIRHRHQTVANVLYNNSSPHYRRWLAQEVENANLAKEWTQIMDRATAVREQTKLLSMERSLSQTSIEDESTFLEKVQTKYHQANEGYLHASVKAGQLAGSAKDKYEKASGSATEAAVSARAKLKGTFNVLRSFWKK